MSFIFTSLQRWIAARDQYNNGHGLLPADRAPVGIPYRDLLRPSDEGGLPNWMPISGSFSAALFFLRRILEAIHRMFSFNACGARGRPHRMDHELSPILRLLSAAGWEDDVDDQDGSDGDGDGLYGQQQQHGGGDGIEHGSDNDEGVWWRQRAYLRACYMDLFFLLCLHTKYGGKHKASKP